jgi:uncharacterized protein YndB with AHSA1/START domain
MREIHGHAEETIDANPELVFGVITDIENLPQWNAAVETVIERPAALTPGTRWTVEMHPSRGMRWRSISTVEEIDSDALRFSYRTVNADGNPSYTLWSWEIVPEGSTSKVSVSWHVYLKTLDRRLLAGPIRRHQLRKEVAASLQAIVQPASSSAS